MKQLKEILWMSISIPYDGVDHAGGKTHNFYIKFMVNLDYLFRSSYMSV